MICRHFTSSWSGESLDIIRLCQINEIRAFTYVEIESNSNIISRAYFRDGSHTCYFIHFNFSDKGHRTSGSMRMFSRPLKENGQYARAGTYKVLRARVEPDGTTPHGFGTRLVPTVSFIARAAPERPCFNYTLFRWNGNRNRDECDPVTFALGYGRVESFSANAFRPKVLIENRTRKWRGSSAGRGGENARVPPQGKRKRDSSLCRTERYYVVSCRRLQ